MYWERILDSSGMQEIIVTYISFCVPFAHSRRVTVLSLALINSTDVFYVQRTRISADRTRLGGIVFECSMQNRRQRNATLIVQDYELWLLRDVHGGRAQFLSRLSLDLTSISTDVPTFTPQSFRPLKLRHFTPNQLQQIEDLRQGKEPHFELRSRLVAHVQYLSWRWKTR
jgi:hypothetical protein